MRPSTLEPDALVSELTEARTRFMAQLEQHGSGAGDARELIAHLGYWVGHAAETIHAVEQGRADEVEAVDRELDARNATVARVARDTDAATVRRREAGSYAALVELMRALDPALLDAPVAGQGSLRERIRQDGALHYLEHAS